MYKKLWGWIFVLFALVCSGCVPNSSNPDYMSTETDAITPSLQTTPLNDSDTTQFQTQDLISQEIAEGKKQGDNIVNAIEKYYENEGDYPETLGDLLPNYLDEIPVTITQQTFSYELSDHFTYMLIFEIERKSTDDVIWFCGYIRRYEFWECGHTYH